MNPADFKRLTPVWEQWNRTGHFAKHGVEVATVLGKDAVTFSKWDFDAASLRTVHTTRVHFEAQHYDRTRDELTELRSYFVDGHLLQAITDRSIYRFISYFPEHFDKPGSLPALRLMTEGDRLMKFKRALFNRERAKMFQHVHLKYGFDRIKA